MTALAMRVRSIAAQQERLSITQRAWPPWLPISLIGGVAGMPWAALPTVNAPDRSSSRIYRVAPLALGLIAATLFLESVWLGVPLTRELAVAALVMVASLLPPVEPLDGGYLKATSATFGVLGASLLVILGVL